MLSDFVDGNEALRYLKRNLEVLGNGYFLKIGKKLENGVLVYWVMVPIEKKLIDNEQKT